MFNKVCVQKVYVQKVYSTGRFQSSKVLKLNSKNYILRITF